MKIFVTGGSGFVGQNLIPVLVEQGHCVMALARSERAAQKVKSLGAEPVMDDLTSLTQPTAKALVQCNWVLHAAAHMDFTYDTETFFNINVKATQRLLKLSRENGVQRFVYISAAPVVPGSPIVNLAEKDAGSGLPTALYPRTKAIAERAVLDANHPDFATISLRPPAIWGPNNHHTEEMLEMVKQGKWRWIGGGNQILSTIHVRNLANAVLAAFNSDKSGGTYFVTDGDQRPLKTTFSAIFKANGVDAGDKALPRGVALFVAHLLGCTWKFLGLKSRPPVAPLMVRLMGTEFSVSDEKAREELGYENALTFEEGIQKLVSGTSTTANSFAPSNPSKQDRNGC